MLNLTEEMVTSSVEEMLRGMSIEKLLEYAEDIKEENPAYHRMLLYFADLDMTKVNQTTIVMLSMLLYKLFKKAYDIEQMEC